MGWAFPWASSLGSEFNFDFNVSFTEEQQREGVVEYNYERGRRNDRANGKLRLGTPCFLTKTVDGETFMQMWIVRGNY